MKLTLNKIRYHAPCGSAPRATPLVGFCKLREYLGEGFGPGAEFSIMRVLDSNDLGDALWCLRAVGGYGKGIRLLAVRYARSVEHFNSDPKVKNCIDIAEKFALGLATEAELAVARTGARTSAKTVAQTSEWTTAKIAEWNSVRAAGAALDSVRADQEAWFRKMVAESEGAS